MITLPNPSAKPPSIRLYHHVLFGPTDRCNRNRVRSHFGDARVFFGRILESQAFHEGPVHILYKRTSINPVDRSGSCSLDAYPHEFTTEVEHFLVFPPGVRYMGEAVGNAAPDQVCCTSFLAAQWGRIRNHVHSFSPFKPSINVNMLLVLENPACAKATLSRTSPIRSFKLKAESGLAASAEILTVVSGLYSTRSVREGEEQNKCGT